MIGYTVFKKGTDEMIVYQLRCHNDHEFEVWFQGSLACTRQMKAKEVACPTCDSTSVEKAIMSPNISAKKNRGAEQNLIRSNPQSEQNVTAEPATAKASTEITPQIVVNETGADEKGATEVALKVLEAVSDFKRHVENTCENVGTNFPEVARQIHYGETEERAIFGEASLDEVKALDEDGIDVIPLGPASRQDH